MQYAVPGLVPDVFPLDGDAPFKVVIVYEDFEAGKNAKRTFDFVVKHAQGECEFSSEMWKFDVMALPKLKQIAVQDALEADLVIVSSRGGELPYVVRDWLSRWLTGKHKAIALVSLCLGDYASSQTTHSYLKRLARDANITFFAQPEAARQEASGEAAPEPRLNPSGERALSTLANAFQRETTTGTPRWGLNE